MNPQKNPSPDNLTLRVWKGQTVHPVCYLYEWGAQGHLVITSQDHSLWFCLSGKIGLLADLLEQLAVQARREAQRYHTPQGRAAAGNNVSGKPAPPPLP